MSAPLPPSSEPLPIQLVRKLILLLLLMVTAALGLLLLLRNLHLYSILLPHLLVDAAMGLAAGFSARWILRRQTVALRLATALAFLVGGLELLGWFTGWQIGLGRLRLGRPNVDWFSLGQVLLGTGVILLSLYAWVAPLRSSAPAPLSVPVPQPPAAKRPRGARKPPVQRPRRKPRPHVAVPAQPDQPTASVTVEPPAKPKRRRTSTRKPQLQLSAQEEHRCPYCLEPIIPDDPRGTVECQICHTLHHADCWAITGACQVPHYTA